MGEIAELVITGVLCEQCGVLMEDLIPEEGDHLMEAPGYPRSCSSCSSDE